MPITKAMIAFPTRNQTCLIVYSLHFSFSTLNIRNQAPLNIYKLIVIVNYLLVFSSFRSNAYLEFVLSSSVFYLKDKYIDIIKLINKLYRHFERENKYDYCIQVLVNYSYIFTSLNEIIGSTL